MASTRFEELDFLVKLFAPLGLYSRMAETSTRSGPRNDRVRLVQKSNCGLPVSQNAVYDQVMASAQ